MNFPKFWAFAKTGSFSSWQWSNTSLQEAQRKAQEAAERTAREFAVRGCFMNRYYAERPLREPVLRELRNDAGDVAAVITRNSYGCEVMNTARAMFVDIDFPDPSSASKVSGMLGSLFGQSPQDPAQDAIAKAENWARSHAGWNWRVYRTAAGLRLLATHALFDPADAVCQAVFDAVDADPLYRTLCHSQECFRARLTPRPWRCETRNPPGRWPYPHRWAEQAFDSWNAEYRAACQNKATCKLVTAGNGSIHPELRQLVTLHDDMTRATSALPLA
jgi:hypothetical protein